MRRTRYVTLPVRSWQYIGLLIVSLSCLTLGLISRDREGRHGTLAGPELQHIAPHKIDACPNINPYTLPTTEDSGTNTKAANEHKTDTLESAKPNLPAPLARKSTKTDLNNRQNRLQRERFLDNRSRNTITRFELSSSVNRRQVPERLTREPRDNRINRSERLQFRSQSRDQVRERRLQSHLGRSTIIRETPSQIRLNQQSLESRMEIRRLSTNEDRRSFRTQDISRTPFATVRRFQSPDRASSLDRQRRDSELARREILNRRTRSQVRVSRSEPTDSIQQRRQLRSADRLSQNNKDTRSGSRDLTLSIKNVRESQRISSPREILLQRQKRDDRMNVLNKRELSRRIDSSRQDNSNPDLTARRQRMSQEQRASRSKLNERISLMMDRRVDNRRDQNNLQSKRMIRTLVKPEIAPKYLNFEISDILNLEILRQAFIAALCVIYGTSIYNDKNSVIKRVAAQINRLVST